MKTEIDNESDTPEPPTIYLLRQQLRSHKRVDCTLCGNAFAEKWIRYFCEGDLEAPVCKRCALEHGFILRSGDLLMRCQRRPGGVIEFSTELPNRPIAMRNGDWIELQ
jgi:hypothetical protein